MSLTDELRDIDWDEAKRIDAFVDFDAQRKAAIYRAMPVGTRVRWKQTPDRGVFEAVGIVSDFAAGVSKAGPWVYVEFTQHPSLEEGRRVVDRFGGAIQLENLEVLP
jgi:hypothetical protein